MRLLDRYLLRELLIPLRYCLGGFLIFWISFDLINSIHQFQEAKLHLFDVVQYYLITVPSFLVIVLPMALLLALLYTLSNHARHHEITAIRAAGISLWRICIPYVAVGLVFSAAVFAINEYWIPDSDQKAQDILDKYKPNRPDGSNKDVYRNFGIPNGRDKRTWDIGSYNLKTEIMTDPKVSWIDTNNLPHRLIAERAERTNDVWTFYNVTEFETMPDGFMGPTMKTNVVAHPEFSETPDQIRREIKFSKRLTSHNAKAAEVPIVDILDYLDLHPVLTKKNKWWLYTQLHGRLAAPWTCLVVVFLAIPFGAASGRRNIFVGVASSIVIVFAYYVLLKLGLALGTGGYVPAWVAGWLPDFVFGAAGIWMLLRVR
ncbi:LptF/LptG family permease [Pedosphaera parvula]|uniref:Permease YjgP/YjgQ family protein n=1 Tax=Pedosphaera parvula (strain Ellin514) TaxID=320771 RepID=B9XEL3_PEDPL|nr:LptF/LptG family permease [Pedosphaera parvula]EEF61727.1 permease YjgP/YjgQ family protein [Pedosphaera parvula Ellin514]